MEHLVQEPILQEVVDSQEQLSLVERLCQEVSGALSQCPLKCSLRRVRRQYENG